MAACLPPLQDGTRSFYLQRLGFESSRWCFQFRFDRTPIWWWTSPTSGREEVRFLSVERRDVPISLSAVVPGGTPALAGGRGSNPLDSSTRMRSTRRSNGDRRWSTLARFDSSREPTSSTQPLGRGSIPLDGTRSREVVSSPLSRRSSAAEQVAHSYEVTGATPVVETNAFLDVAQQYEHVGDNHAVAGATPAIQTIDRPITPLFQGRDTILRRLLVEVQILSVAPRVLHTPPSG